MTVCYAPDAQVLPPNEPAARRTAAIRTVFQRMRDQGEFTIDPLEIELIEASGDLAYAIGAHHFVARRPTGETVRDDGKFLSVWRRQTDGSWRCVADSFNSDLAATR